jgi:hypothetical protein
MFGRKVHEIMVFVWNGWLVHTTWSNRLSQITGVLFCRVSEMQYLLNIVILKCDKVKMSYFTKKKIQIVLLG